MAYITFQPHDYFNVKLYTGNGSTQSVTGVGFQPDWVWIKGRGSSAYDHQLFDAVRGATKAIASNDNSTEATYSNSVTSFDSDGFSLGDFARTNSNGDNKVAWNWRAGAGAGSSNTDGSINTTSTSVNTTAGFSISKYTGTGSVATIGHGLGAVPSVVLVKRLDSSSDWRMFHTGAGPTKQLFLNTTGQKDDDNTIWNDTAPTSSVFTVGTNTGSNASGGTYVAYCFTDIKGFSKCGKYLGNGSATESGVIYLGFKPSFFMIKNIDASEPWMMYDAKRLGYNPAYSRIYANTNGQEDAETKMDFISTGVKLRSAGDGHINQNGYNFVYMAFAENPLVSSNNIPALAKGI